MSAKPMRQSLARTAPPPDRASKPRGPWLRLLAEVLELAGPDAEFLHHAERPWSSATFSGSRHTVTLAFSGHEETGCGDAFITALPDHEFAIPAQLVADAAITSVIHETLPVPRMTVVAELLLLEDA